MLFALMHFQASFKKCSEAPSHSITSLTRTGFIFGQLTSEAGFAMFTEIKWIVPFDAKKSSYPGSEDPTLSGSDPGSEDLDLKARKNKP